MGERIKQILVVDDASTVRLYHRMLLEKIGFTVDEAMNGLEALEKAFARHYDLLLVDINMPKMNGLAFLRELRSHQEIYQAPALVVSVAAENKDRREAFSCGANFYFIKPTKPEVLVRAARLLTGGV
jgi:two-component system chemotaxis response regulator CheY